MIVDEVHGRVKWFRFWHKESYQRQQQQFWHSYRLHNYQIIFVIFIIQSKIINYYYFSPTFSANKIRTIWTVFY